MQKAANINLAQELGVKQLEFEIDISLRDCKIGEAYSSTGE